jgi:hypothetical protein
MVFPDRRQGVWPRSPRSYSSSPDPHPRGDGETTAMSLSSFLKSTAGRLHYQIVLPLIGATALVGLIASFVGIVIVSGIVDRWVDEDAEASTRALATHFDDVQARLEAATRLISEDPLLTWAPAGAATRRRRVTRTTSCCMPMSGSRYPRSLMHSRQSKK